MKNNMSAAGRLSIAVASLVLAACASAPKETFYTLSPAASASAVSATAASATADYAVAVGPVRVPEIVDRPQLVVRRGPTQVDLLEQHRWAQPLRAEIAQAVASHLRAALPGARVALDRDAAAQNADYRVALDISRFDATPGEAVTVQALWSIRPANDKPAVSGQATVREAVRGAGNDDIAGAFSRAVTGIGRDIAASLTALRGAGAGAAP
jgi:uncharacterized lipoprotein YmbA